jgi:hypothetical protein
MTKKGSLIENKVATVSEPVKKKRQFTWTEKRKAQFEKLVASNKTRKLKQQKETVAEVKEEDIENVHAQNILKRIMDPHYLSKSDRSNQEKEKENGKEISSSESDESSSSDEEVDVKKEVPVAAAVVDKVKEVVPERVEILKSSKLLGKYRILKAKNKQLEKLIINTKLKKSKKLVPEVSEEPPESPEPVKKKVKKTQQEVYAQEVVPDYPANSFYFC